MDHVVQELWALLLTGNGRTDRQTSPLSDYSAHVRVMQFEFFAYFFTSIGPVISEENMFKMLTGRRTVAEIIDILFANTRANPTETKTQKITTH